MKDLLKFVRLLLLVGMFEIVGGWFVWRAANNSRPLWWGITAILVFCVFGIASTLPTPHFGRMYAAYGAFFVILSLIWGLGLDGKLPDKFDLIGAAVSLAGIAIMFYAPRG